jgi:hypothetical protein
MTETAVNASNLAWGQAGIYNAIDDREVITALSRGHTGLINAPAITAGAGLSVNVGAWLAILNCGDGTVAAAYSRQAANILVQAGPSVGSRTDAVWVDIDPDNGAWTMGLRSPAETVGRLGVRLGTITVPAGANASNAFTLAAAAADYDPTWDSPVRNFASDAARTAAWLNPQSGCLSFTTDTQTLAVFRFGAWRGLPVTYPRQDGGAYVGTFDPRSPVQDMVGHTEPVTNASGGFSVSTQAMMGFLPRCIVGAQATPSNRLWNEPVIVCTWLIYNSTPASVAFQARHLADGTTHNNANAPCLLRIAYQR